MVTAPSPGRSFTRRVGWRILVANGVAASFVWVYLVFLAPSEVARQDADVLTSLGFFLGFVVVAGAVYLWVSESEWRRTLAGLDAGADPAPAERRAVLAEPGRHAAIILGAWLGAAVFFGIGSVALADTSVGHGVKVALAACMGGVGSAAVAYLLVERSLRDVWARVLPAGPQAGGAAIRLQTRILLVWALGSGIPLLALAVLPLTSAGAVERGNINGAVTCLALAGLANGLFIARAGAGSIVEPVDQVRVQLGRIAAGDLDAEVQVTDPAEVGLLQAGFNEMARGLRERERLRELFSRHVGDEVVEHELAATTRGLGGEVTHVTALFVDLVGSTSLAERLDPTAVVELLNHFFRTVVRVVSEEGGRIDKFEGDGALCVFGPPAAPEDQAAGALRAARGLLAALDDPELRSRGLAAGIGVSSGLVVAGNVGSEDRYEYTVIGQPVNEAARLADLAKAAAPAAVVAAATACASGSEQRWWRQDGRREIRGQSAPVHVWVPLARG